MTAVTKEQLEARAREHGDAGFGRWLADPMTRIGLSMIPAGEQQDTLRLLLRSAFDAGAGFGGAEVILSLLDAMMKKKGPA